MINITKKELNNLKIIGKGRYGTVYQVNDDIAYKIYHEIIHNREGYDVYNPANSYLKSRINKLIRKQKNIKYTDLPKDIIKINGKYGGIIIPYYEGKTLEQLKDNNYQIKKDLSRKIIQAHNELIQNRIYTTDYHLENIMVVDNKIKIIDLDDMFTHSTLLPNKLLKIISTVRINQTIRDLFEDSHYTIYDPSENKYLNRNRLIPSSNKTWQDAFFYDKEKIQSYILINNTSDINKIKDLLNNKSYRIIYLLSDEEKDITILTNIINYYKNNNINIYDFVEENKIYKYLTNYPIKEELLIDNSNIKQLTK